MYTGKIVLVTGGAGFIGSHLVDALLAAGVKRVIVVDNFFLGQESNLNTAKTRFSGRLAIYRESAAEYSAMAAIFEREKPDLVCNLATKALLYSFFNPAGAFEVNTQIAQTLGELLRQCRYGRLLHVSSSEVYGTAKTVPMDENHTLSPETSYAAGKAAADMLLLSYVNMFDLDIVIARPFNNYGPRQNDKALAAVIPLTITRIIANHAPAIEGDGQQTRDFIYVADTVAAIMKLAVLPQAKGLCVNLGHGQETSIADLVGMICQAMRYEGPVERHSERRADVRRHYADVSLCKSLIGEFASTSMIDGLAQTIAWHLKQVSQ